MANVKIKNEGEAGKVTYQSQSKKEDFKAITLNSDGKVYVEHVILADNLIKKGVAKEAKGVEFEIEKDMIILIGDVKN